MGDIVRFVDSIAADPTVRLDLNDEQDWFVRSFSAPPPRLRRAVSSNAMRDGINVSSSLYDARVLTITVDLITTTQDDNATQLQRLARELDRADNFLMYQPTGATRPVFFRLFRSDMSQIENVTGPNAFRKPTLELLAEPFALGLRETIGPVTVNNDPAAGSNGLFFDVTGVIGDVSSPCVLWDTSRSLRFGMVAVRQHGTPSDFVPFFFQGEAGAGAGVDLGADTTNPGGGPDAAMSGAGTNNYVRTSFAGTPAMAFRVSVRLFDILTTTAQRRAAIGRYRVLAVVRRSDNTSAMTARASLYPLTLPTVTIPLSTSRQLIDLGVVTIGDANLAMTGQTSAANAPPLNVLNLSAARSSGAGTLDWDYVALIPADERYLAWSADVVGSTSHDTVVDAVKDSLWWSTAGDPLTGTGVPFASVTIAASGGFPSLVPNQTNRIFFLDNGDTASIFAVDKTRTSSIQVDYWPRYLFVRPNAT